MRGMNCTAPASILLSPKGGTSKENKAENLLKRSIVQIILVLIIRRVFPFHLIIFSKLAMCQALIFILLFSGSWTLGGVRGSSTCVEPQTPGCAHTQVLLTSSTCEP